MNLAVIDFDIAVLADAGSTISGSSGTSGWSAHEISAGKSYNPLLADRCSCGRVLTFFTERTKPSKLRLQLCSLSQRLIDPGPYLRPPVTDIPNLCPQKMGNPEPLGSTHRIGPQWTHTWEGKKQQEAQWTHTTGLDAFASCQAMNESDTRTVYVCLSSSNSMPLTT